MTVEDLIELLADYPQNSTVMLACGYDDGELQSIECGRDFISQEDTVILCGQ